MIEKLIKKNRSYRRFQENVKVERKTLESLIDLARLGASAANRQPLKYIIANKAAKNSLIFNTLGWAGYLKDWSGPEEGKRPSAYIIMLGDREISDKYMGDPGIAAQNILLGAVAKNLGGCILGSIKREVLRKSLDIPERYKILYVLALGKPAEKVEIENIGVDGDIKYWRDNEGVHHVPKRSLTEIIIDI